MEAELASRFGCVGGCAAAQFIPLHLLCHCKLMDEGIAEPIRGQHKEVRAWTAKHDVCQVAAQCADYRRVAAPPCRPVLHRVHAQHSWS